jgi:hypothetical protein
MLKSVEQIVKEHIKESKAFRKSIKGNPVKARDFLKKVGILKETK